uniref:Uncharacterized protein n=2 Tax=Meloidogyne TaxID=189290 RepID=A0A6V7WXP6_MELEN|nr:unnamed protein product [Meloidogyne enterolobii]
MATGNQCNLTPSTKFPHQWKLFNSLDKTTASKQQLGPKLYKIQTVFGDVLGLGTQNFRTFVINLILVFRLYPLMLLQDGQHYQK